MQKTLATIALFGALVGATDLPEDDVLYFRSAEEMTYDGLPIVDLQVMDDENFPGVVFSGTAESIVNEMKALKPGIFDNQELASNNTELRLVEERGEVTKRSVNCNWGKEKVGRWDWCIEGMTYLRNLGSRRCGVGPAGACARVSCSNSCGMYLCNKLPHDNWVYCNMIPADINHIASTCISPTLGWFKGARDFTNHFIGLARDSC